MSTASMHMHSLRQLASCSTFRRPLTATFPFALRPKQTSRTLPSLRAFSSPSALKNISNLPPSNGSNSPTPSCAATTPQNHITFEPPEPHLSMTFTCTVEGCQRRSTHQFTKRSYEKGIVLVQCPGCKNRHLIADHLGWFKESTQDGELKTVEDILRVKGEKVQRGRIDAGGVVEYSPE